MMYTVKLVLCVSAKRLVVPSQTSQPLKVQYS